MKRAVQFPVRSHVATDNPRRAHASTPPGGLPWRVTSRTFCSAHARSSRLSLGTDDPGWSIDVPQGISQIEPGHIPHQDMTIGWNTWSEFEEEDGTSRFWAGGHFPPSISAGQAIGREIGTLAHDDLTAHINGTPP